LQHNCKSQKVQCEFCGKDVWRKPSYLKRFKHFFCNRKCRGEKTKSQRIHVNCTACEKEVLLTNARKRHSRTGLYFCNNTCKNPYIARYKRWSANPDQHRTRRPAVLEAANNTCQNCNKQVDQKMLDIHHSDVNHSNNNWNNLKCLCVWCHIGHHRQCVVLKNLEDLSEIIKTIITEQEFLSQKQSLKLENKCTICNTSISSNTKNQLCMPCFGKSLRKTERPPKHILEAQINELGYCGTARLYKVSDNAIRKWLK